MFRRLNPVRCATVLGLLTAILVCGESGLLAQKKAATDRVPDFTAGDTIPEGAKHDWNLGPTGARGWIYSNKLETTQARQILVTQVREGSPADGVLKPGDVILGLAGKEFSYDPRTEFGKAISSAEAGLVSLTVIRWRNGKSKSVAIILPKLGEYSSTAPFDCLKSKRIFQEGCEVLAARMKSDPKATANPIVRCLNALALLSSGNEKYMPIVREQVEWASKYSDPQSRSLHAWYYGPVNLLLAEYTLATGDKTYLEDMARVTAEIIEGQSKVGSWGHRFARPDGRLNGYGMMNAPGLPMTVSLVLARKAGVKDPDLSAAIERSSRLVRFYVGKGSVPYGDHHPWIETHDDNGKNGAAALLFNLLKDAEAAEYFSRMSVASHGAEKETGHTGNFFNMLWAMPGVALSGPQATGAWIEEFGWYYDLARQADGSFQHQGPPQLKHDSYRGWDASGLFLLAYAQPLRKLHITGRQDAIVKPIDEQTAASLIADGRDYSHRIKQKAYANRSVDQLIDGLQSWSPVVRERSARSLAQRVEADDIEKYVARLTELLNGEDLHSRIGACQALAQLKERAAPAIAALQKTLDAQDLWLRVKATEALAAIGKEARPVVPQLLTMMAEENAASDSRGMQQRYLCFALFDRREGLLRGSLVGIDRPALYAAIRAGLNNEDGRARGVLGSVYNNLSFEELEPLLPAIHKAILEPAPSGTMFADGIRLSGLEILAKHKFKEGIPLSIELIDMQRWGQGKRLSRCLKVLLKYGSAAKQVLPDLKEMQRVISAKRQNKNTEKQLKLLAETITMITGDTETPDLRTLSSQ